MLSMVLPSNVLWNYQPLPHHPASAGRPGRDMEQDQGCSGVRGLAGGVFC